MRKRKPTPPPSALPAIVRTRDDATPIDSLLPHPDNDNHGDLDAIEESLLSKGQYKSIIVQASTRFICAGNHTWAAMKRIGAATISADFLDIDDATALEILLADNATARHGRSTADATAAILEKLRGLRPAGADLLRGTGLAGLSGTEAILKRLRAAPTFLVQLPEGGEPGAPGGGDREARQGGEAPSARQEHARHPLAIVLTNAEKRRWDAKKAALKTKNDKAALLALLDATDDDGGGEG